MRYLAALFLIAGVLTSSAAPLLAAPVQLAGGGYHLLAVHSDHVDGLGDGTYGQLGSNPDGAPATVVGLTGVTQVAAGGFSSLALKSDGTVWFLGEVTLQHTTAHGTPDAITSAVQVTGLSGIDVLSAGHRHFLALDHDRGELFAWGHNGSGQVGDGGLLDVSTPTLVLTGVSSMAAGDGFSLAVMGDQTVMSWGRNSHGQLGLGDTADRVSPTQIPGVATALGVAAGGQHSLILLTNGTVRATGNNAFGQLGLGTTTPTSTPITVPGLSGISTIAAGYQHSAALSASNLVLLWGRNFEGQCGGGASSAVRVAAPQVVTTLPAGLTGVACGYHFSIFIFVDGTVWGTGSNSDGQLDGSSVADQDSSQKILAPQLLPILIDSHGFGENYCAAGSNSTGGAATISAVGSTSVAANNLELTAKPVPNQHSLFFHGNNQAQFPFGNGLLCVGGTIARLNPPQIAVGNISTRVVDVPLEISAAGTLHFQCWFRDPAAGGAWFNLSDGLSLTFVP